MIRVLIDKWKILFSEVWDGVDHRTYTKTRGSKYKNALRTSKHIYKQINIPDFQLCYPCKCLTRYARSPINKHPRFSIVLPLLVSRSLRSLANKLTSPIFDCVTPVSVSLAKLARQLYRLTLCHYTEYKMLLLVLSDMQ